MTYDAFLDAVQDHLSIDDREAAAELATVGLKTFSDSLYRTERLTADTFLNRIQAQADLNRDEARVATRVVLDVLREAADASILSEIGDHLPSSYAELFPFVNRSLSA